MAADANLTEQLFPARAISARNRDSIPLRISFCPITSEICTVPAECANESIEFGDQRHTLDIREIWHSKRHFEISLRAQRRSKMRSLLIHAFWRLPSPFGRPCPSAAWSIVRSVDPSSNRTCLMALRTCCGQDISCCLLAKSPCKTS